MSGEKTDNLPEIPRFSLPLCWQIRRVTMTVTYDTPPRGAQTSVAPLEGRFQVMKEVGDGSFGSVAVARVRTAGAHIARRGTMVWKHSP